ncbi:sigma-54-dependent transcriptional regulator [Nitrospira lenta]|uniref:Transcriptional regulatory protein ZraR n=1 Tax=Nitrospira lenta TaxID=1436998 RepID=A0A330L0N1_9BACT|nr:sigma-54 dependent transcriptional regulator [Nitrospira lenta]SPP63290.1 Transcriptional regulatory protein ZraR [Nitrospira lenta]
MNPTTILLISRDPQIRHALEQVVPSHTTILAVPDVAAGIKELSRENLALVLCEGSPEASRPLLHHTNLHPSSPSVILIGSRDSARDAVEALRAGATDYLSAPIAVPELDTVVRRALSAQNPPAASKRPADRFDLIVSLSPQMQLIKQLAREVAATDATVLITGESGTGKELVAQAIHDASPRALGPLIALNCAGIPEQLLESELFGYHQGAFTDAKHTKAGRFQLAEGGTLFLDEIGEMSASAQAKLLRVLEDHRVDPLGDTHSHTVNIRIIAATNEDLPAQIKTGRFRLDLYYRLNVYQLRIPPLRERLEDIAPILQHFLAQARRDRGCRIADISPEALAVLQRHHWPGNVRELHNVVEWLTITCKAQHIEPQHLPSSVKTGKAPDLPGGELKPSLLAFGLSFQDMEKKMLEEALRKSGGNVSEASRLLKITRNTLRYRMAKHRIQ